MRAHSACWIVPALLAFAAPALGAPLTAADLVARILRGPTVAYEGTQLTTVASAGGALSAGVRVRGNGHGGTLREFDDGNRMARLDLGKSCCQRTGNEWVRLPDRAVGAESAAAAAIMANYVVTVGPPVTIAGRLTLPIHMVHRSAFDPSRSVWLDPSTGIVMKDRLLAPDGRERSLSLFSRLRLGPQPAALFREPTAFAASALVGPGSFEPRPTAPSVEAETGGTIRYPAYVPAGYRVALYGVMHTGSGRLMPAVRYSNGLAAFTIFQRGAGPGRGNGRRGWRFGAPNGSGPAGTGAPRCVGRSDVQSAVVEATGQRSSYVLVGDLAEAELLKVAKTLP